MLSFPWPSVSSGDGKKIPVDQVHVNERAQPLNQKLLDELSDFDRARRLAGADRRALVHRPWL